MKSAGVVESGLRRQVEQTELKLSRANDAQTRVDEERRRLQVRMEVLMADAQRKDAELERLNRAARSQFKDFSESYEEAMREEFRAMQQSYEAQLRHVRDEVDRATMEARKTGRELEKAMKKELSSLERQVQRLQWDNEAKAKIIEELRRETGVTSPEPARSKATGAFFAGGKAAGLRATGRTSSSSSLPWGES